MCPLGVKRCVPPLRNKEAAVAAPSAVHLRYGAVEAPDREQTLEACGGAVAEVNATPGLHYPYHDPVAVVVLRQLLGLSPPRATLNADEGIHRQSVAGLRPNRAEPLA